LPECLAEAAAGSGIGQVRPEGARQKIAGVGATAIGDQVGEKGTSRAGSDRRKRGITPGQDQAAEEADLQERP
jgi:hypothetical protein